MQLGPRGLGKHDTLHVPTKVAPRVFRCLGEGGRLCSDLGRERVALGRELCTTQGSRQRMEVAMVMAADEVAKAASYMQCCSTPRAI